MALHYAKCCHPLPGEPIVGIISTGRGVKIHKNTCQNLSQFQDHPEKWIDVEWGGISDYEASVFDVILRVVVENRSGALAVVSAATSRLKANIDNLKVILPAYNLVVGLNVTKPYTSSDTPVYGRPDSGNDFKVAGPFVSGRLFKATNVLLRGNVKYSINEDFIPFKINNPFGVFERKYYNIENTKLCGDTVYVNIDVK